MSDQGSFFDDEALLEEIRGIHRADRAPDAFRQRAIAGVRDRLHADDGGGSRWFRKERLPQLFSTERPLVGAMRWGRGAAVLALIVGIGVAHELSERDVRLPFGRDDGAQAPAVLPGAPFPAAPFPAAPFPAAPSTAAPSPAARAGSGAAIPPCPENRRSASDRATHGEMVSGGLSLHTFQQDTRRGCALQRKYWQYVPAGLGAPEEAPVLVILHAGGERVESWRSVQLGDRVDELARRDGFIAVYASASGKRADTWQLEDESDVDEEAYLELLVADMQDRGVIGLDNAIFLLGHREGADVALRAAANQPHLYNGVAALMATTRDSPLPELADDARLSRVLFLSRTKDARTIVHDWALSLGIPHTVIEQARPVALPDRIVEGEGHVADGPMARASRNSRIERFDLLSPQPGGPAIRALFLSASASHLLPMAQARDTAQQIEQLGFRNQDADAAAEAWDFLRAAVVP